MPRNSIDLFVNPTAGRGRAGRRLPRICELIEAGGVTVSIHESRDVGDLETQVRTRLSEGIRQLIVAGGDGSVHEAINAILDSGCRVAFGLVPTGTGNDFAKAAQIPLDWEAAATLLARRIADNAPSRKIDVGKMNARYFANGAGIGLDAKVTRIARSYRWPMGDAVYLLAILRTMIDEIATPYVDIESDALSWHGPLTLASISNGPWIGGMFHIAPMAKNDDGKLELLIAAPVTRRRIMGLLPKLMQGDHVGEPEITFASVRKVTIRASEPIPSHLDGEVQPMQTDFDIDLLPDALDLL